MSKPVAFAHDGIKYMVRDASDTTDVKARGAMAWIYNPRDNRLDQYASIQTHVKFGWDWQPYTGPTPAGLDEAWAAMEAAHARIKVRRVKADNGVRLTKITRAGRRLTVWGRTKDSSFKKLDEYPEDESDKALSCADQFLKSK